MTMVWIPGWAEGYVSASRDDEDDEPYDDTKDHDLCPDCGHTDHPGWYIGVTVKEHCERCDGSGVI